MMYVFRAALVAVALGWVTPVAAQLGPPEGHGGGMMGGGPPPGPPAFLTRVFSPKLVMEHQQEIALRPGQIEAIKKAMNEAQQRLVDIQWRLDAESEALGKLLAPDRVDEAAVLAKLEQVTAIEQELKKVNFTLLVRIKNQLDPQQQAKLRDLRSSFRFGPGNPPPLPPPPG